MKVIYTPGPDDADPLSGAVEPLRYLEVVEGDATIHELIPNVVVDVPDDVGADLLDTDAHRVAKA